MPRKTPTQEEVTEVFIRFIRELYEGIGLEIPDEFCPEREVSRVLTLLKGVDDAEVR